MEFNQNHTGFTIRRILKLKGISVSETAKFLGMSVSGVYDIFKRKSITDDALLEKIAELTEEPVAEILSHDASGRFREDEDTISSYERAIFEWKTENEFLKEQIKEKDYLIKMLIEKMTGK
ncbi:helix-turn-helix domain-containing protein [Siphonobacter aquaeclarae]|uniref:Helix-turn-helix n=1 Tax=Siphonobacter aquaeclarae TaxID=563176 RepID=A0A1G9R938_9BACT|nr:helix-turn-helix transcriptional regulator [Siphonobacter aquaeclarae]SDM19786.1 Helix-turn-helix [Siphonobacter aquaeclarae]